MFFPKVSLQDWCNTWNLEIEAFQCDGCGKARVADIPIEYDKETVGLTSGICKNCGDEEEIDVMTFRGKFNKKINNFLRGLNGRVEKKKS